MQKNKDSKKRESRYNPNRSCYLTADGKYYCYEIWDPDTKTVVTHQFEVGKDLSVELTMVLDEMDHRADLNDRYQRELRHPLFDKKLMDNSRDDEESLDVWETIGDKKNSVEAALFSEPEQENPEVAKVRNVIDNQCTKAQQDLIFRHFGMGEQLEAIRQAEATQTGKLPSCVAMTNRKNKILDKVAKALDVVRTKRCNQAKKVGK
jgi:hypothetical protein